ncbi:kinase-like protein, partial [Marasmius fiardii PR-910]
NILVDEQGRCHLGDFGLAAASRTNTLLSRITRSQVKGTMRWMAPELFDYGDSASSGSTNPGDVHENPNPGDVKPASDIYAFACTVYEVRTGSSLSQTLYPFLLILMFQVIAGRRPERPTSVSWCPDSVWALVQQCWVQKSHLRLTAGDVYGFLCRLERLRGEALRWEEFPLPVQEEE